LPDFTNVVIYCPAGISDTILATPLASAIKEASPAARVTWICADNMRDVLISACPNVDEAIDVSASMSDEEVRKVIKNLQPDLIINFSSMPIVNTLMGKMKSLVHPNRTVEVTALIDHKEALHDVDAYLEILKPLGFEPPAKPFPTLFPEAFRETLVEPLFEQLGLQMEEPLVGIVPGVGGGPSTKAWLTDGWVYLIEAIKVNARARCILLGGVDDVEVCREIASQVGDHCIDLSGQGTLVELAALMKTMALVISGDCGALHLAVAADTPVIGLYGSTNPATHGPYNQDMLVVSQFKHCQCVGKEGCMEEAALAGPGNCMRQISLEAIMEKVYMVLRSDQPPAPVRDSTNWFWAPRREQPTR
jgi:ADP-heptose:LPS heptosyltransferase